MSSKLICEGYNECGENCYHGKEHIARMECSRVCSALRLNKISNSNEVYRCLNIRKVKLEELKKKNNV